MGGELAAVCRVVVELGAESGEGEGLDQIRDNALRDRMLDHIEVARGGHRDHIARLAGAAQVPQKSEPVAVRQVHVEEDQIHGIVTGQEFSRRAGRSCHPGDLEVEHSTDVGGMGLGCDFLVLDHQHPERHAGSRGGGVSMSIMKDAPPRLLVATSIRPECRRTSWTTSASPIPRPQRALSAVLVDQPRRNARSR